MLFRSDHETELVKAPLLEHLERGSGRDRPHDRRRLAVGLAVSARVAAGQHAKIKQEYDSLIEELNETERWLPWQTELMGSGFIEALHPSVES